MHEDASKSPRGGVKKDRVSIAEPTPPGAVGVAFVEDDARTRQAFSMLVGEAPGLRCVACWGSVEEALRGAPAEPPAVILLDIGLPGIPGPEGVEPLKARYPQAVVVMLTVFEDEEEIFASLCNGACGYLLKNTHPARLLEAIREAAAGGAPMSPGIARKVVHFFRGASPAESVGAELSHQERTLLGLLAAGESYATAAAAMRVSVNSVRGYVRTVYEKLHVHTKSAAVAKALKAGLI
jgi:DNA-binding NarL/FixJ family response regulator